MMEKPRYRTFSAYLKERFKEPVRKIGLHAGFTCPNRDGSISEAGCIFCEPQTFSPHAVSQPRPLVQQIREGIAQGKRKGIHAFMAYFQAYTNTYGSVRQLKEIYDVVYEFPEICAMAIGTRPDCVDDAILELIHTYTKRYEVWLEYGLQSMHDTTLRAVNRGHGFEAFLKAVTMTRRFSGIQICAHVILGLPGEGAKQELETADALAQLKLEAVKLHPLYVVRETALAKQYQAGRYQPLTLADYTARLVGFLERLHPEMVIQRLTADCSADDLVAPQWILDKAGVIQAIRKTQQLQNSWQGKACGVFGK
ncbi:TIGR01212 family radical SAM protein [bacterium]|nr:TIGR01212 family radical SAM protein [bacterium]